MAKKTLADYASEGDGGRGGLVCPRCGCHNFRTYSTYQSPLGAVRRRKICRHCGAFISTVEREVGKGRRE